MKFSRLLIVTVHAKDDEAADRAVGEMLWLATNARVSRPLSGMIELDHMRSLVHEPEREPTHELRVGSC